MSEVAVPFRRGAVKPIECFRLGFNAMAGQYGLLLGMTLVGMLLASYGPLGILMGPMFCGLYGANLRRLSGEKVTFGQLFGGFDYFVESLLATIPIFAASVALTLLVIGVTAVEVAGLVFFAGGAGSSHAEPAAGLALSAVALVFLTVLVLALLLFLPLSILTAFTYPLIVDRRLPGFDALALGARAGLANFWGLFGLLALIFLLGCIGACFCYVGALLVLPLSFAAQTVAYRQVFPAVDSLPQKGGAAPAGAK
jgi:hypothetical protein